MSPDDLAGGCCWLGPHPGPAEVYFVGVAVTAGAHLPLYLCAPCEGVLRQRVHDASGGGGGCWLWCGQEQSETLSIGVVEAGGRRAGLYACRRCVWLIETAIIHAAVRGDRAGSRLGAHRYQPIIPSGRHLAA